MGPRITKYRNSLLLDFDETKKNAYLTRSDLPIIATHNYMVPDLAGRDGCVSPQYSSTRVPETRAITFISNS